MRIDQLADTAATELHDATERAEFTVAAPGSRQAGRRVAAVAAALLVAAAIGGTAWLMDGDGGGEVAADDDQAPATVAPATDEPGFVTLAGERFAVGDVFEAFDQAPVYGSVVAGDGASAMMSELGFGEESPIQVDTPKVADPDIIDGPAIYLGDIDGDSAFLTEETYGEEPQKCLWIGPTPQVCGDYGLITIHPANDVSATVWLGVPQGTVAVALFEETGGLLGWQQPRSRVVVITVQADEPQPLAMVAFDADGEEILRVGQFEADRETPDVSPSEAVTTTRP